MSGKNINEVLAENLRNAMGAEGLTQAKLGQMTGMGQTTVGLYLRPHDRKPGTSGKIPSGKLSELESLATALGKAPHELLVADAKAGASPPGIGASVARLAHALALEMPDEMREDVGELLAKLAKRKGGTPEQRAQLVSLLRAFERPELVPAQTGGRLDVAHVVSQSSDDDAPSSLSSEDDSKEGVEEWNKRFNKSTGNLRPKAGGRTGTTTSQTRPKAKPGMEKKT